MELMKEYMKLMRNWMLWHEEFKISKLLTHNKI